MTHALVAPLLIGVKWLDPEWMLSEFGSAFFWVRLEGLAGLAGSWPTAQAQREVGMADGAAERSLEARSMSLCARAAEGPCPGSARRRLQAQTNTTEGNGVGSPYGG
jgi:hypothetical protein